MVALATLFSGLRVYRVLATVPRTVSDSRFTPATPLQTLVLPRPREEGSGASKGSLELDAGELRRRKTHTGRCAPIVWPGTTVGVYPASTAEDAGVCELPSLSLIHQSLPEQNQLPVPSFGARVDIPLGKSRAPPLPAQRLRAGVS